MCLSGLRQAREIKGAELCQHHHADRTAPSALKEYFESYTSPFPQNQQYLAQLASTINWEAVVKGEMKIRGRISPAFALSVIS